MRQKRYDLKAANFYEATGNWNNALNEFNIAFPFFMSDNANIDFRLLEQKARLLGNTGKKDEAIELYKQVIIQKDPVNNEWFDSQLNELITIYDTDHLKLKNNKLEFNASIRN